MQYPVPQFTDVEDKIIGPLSLKQFLILFGAGVIMFLVFTVTQSVAATIFAFLIVGVPAIGVAFAKVNGRPLYNTIGLFLSFLTSPKQLVFHKESTSFTGLTKLKNVEIEKTEALEEPMSRETTETRLKEVSQLLTKQAQAESELSKKIQ